MEKFKFDIVGRRYWWFSLSALILFAGLIAIATQGFNLGIDFTGGTLLDLKFNQEVTVGHVREALKDFNLETSTIQLSGGEAAQSSNVFIRTRVLTEDERRNLTKGLEEKLGAFDVLRIENVGAVIGSELTRQAAISVVLSWALIVVYIAYRFELRFAVSGVIGLIHVTLVVLGMVSILQEVIDASFIAALLTIIGYAINDTIVIFDRIRENLKSHRKSESLAELVNKSIWQTMTRSIYTVLTVLFAVVALYYFGGETTQGFSLVLFIGFSIGAYSSIFIASPVWVMWREYDERKRLELKIKGEK